MKIIIIGLISLFFSNNDTSDTWDKIKNKTWLSQEDGIFGAQIVFLNDKIGNKAIKQLSGSGCCVIMTFVYNVKIDNDTIRLFLDSFPQIDLENQNSIKKNDSIFIFLKEENLILSKDAEIKYKIRTNEPQLYKSCCQQIEIEKLVNDTIRINDFL